MDIIEAIRSRKSIRGFKPDPIPRDVLRKVLEIATRAPSGVNKQPWEITVIAGKVLDSIRRANVRMLASKGEDSHSRRLEGVYRQRQVEIAVQLFQLMGIARDDKEKRAAWRERGFRYFDAPAAIILSVDKSLDGFRALLDLGMLAQNICLAALHFGLGTCIEGQGVTYPEVLRKYVGIPESKRIATSIAIGYPDWDFPANKVESKREPVDNVTTWCGFDEGEESGADARRSAVEPTKAAVSLAGLLPSPT